MKSKKHFLSFNKKKRVLILESGVLLEDVINTFLPFGWFPKIVPGTKFITIGGAIAADIHGKNHHKEGCFSEAVNWFKLKINNDNIVFLQRKILTYFLRLVEEWV